MRLAVNGEEREVDTPLTINGLLRRLGIAPDGIAVAVNRRLVAPAERDTRELAEADEVEIVRAAPGG